MKLVINELILCSSHVVHACCLPCCLTTGAGASNVMHSPLNNSSMCLGQYKRKAIEEEGSPANKTIIILKRKKRRCAKIPTILEKTPEECG